jgi:hypothetical protein
VSLGETSVCILDKDGTRIFEGKVASEPAPIACLIRKRATALTSIMVHPIAAPEDIDRLLDDRRISASTTSSRECRS